jgi:hypothetical protein
MACIKETKCKWSQSLSQHSNELFQGEKSVGENRGSDRGLRILLWYSYSHEPLTGQRTRISKGLRQVRVEQVAKIAAQRHKLTSRGLKRGC